MSRDLSQSTTAFSIHIIEITKFEHSVCEKEMSNFDIAIIDSIHLLFMDAGYSTSRSKYPQKYFDTEKGIR